MAAQVDRDERKDELEQHADALRFFLQSHHQKLGVGGRSEDLARVQAAIEYFAEEDRRVYPIVRIIPPETWKGRAVLVIALCVSCWLLGRWSA